MGLNFIKQAIWCEHGDKYEDIAPCHDECHNFIGNEIQDIEKEIRETKNSKRLSRLQDELDRANDMKTKCAGDPHDHTHDIDVRNEPYSAKNENNLESSR